MNPHSKTKIYINCLQGTIIFFKYKHFISEKIYLIGKTQEFKGQNVIVNGNHLLKSD